MANLLILKNRIRSVKNIAQITKAMELVAATKMKRAQQRVLNARDYSTELENLVNKMSGSLSTEGNIYIDGNNSEKNLLIIVGPSKGLAGGLVSNLGREVYNFLKENPDTDVISIDKKGAYIAERTGKNIIAVVDKIKTNIDESELEPVFDIVKEYYKSSQYSRVYVIYTHFINTLVQKPKTDQILPVNIKNNNEKINENDDVVIEPDKDKVIEYLLEKYIENKLFLSVLDSISSEYSARMIAMKNANDNATEIKDDLTLEYNQSRQAAITQQILEIAGATAAMESNE